MDANIILFIVQINLFAQQKSSKKGEKDYIIYYACNKKDKSINAVNIIYGYINETCISVRNDCR